LRALADHLVLLDQGRTVASGPLNDVLTRIDLLEAFADDAGVVIQARDLSLNLVQQTGSSILNCVTAMVADLAVTETPGHVLVRLGVGGEPLLARITKRSAEHLAIHPGLNLYAQIKAVALLG